jgi:hypothetical protein
MLKKLLLKRLLPLVLELVRVDTAGSKDELPKRDHVILRREVPFGFIQVYLNL